jgi:aspartate/methionine/tyrosine aminotransferase
MNVQREFSAPGLSSRPATIGGSFHTFASCEALSGRKTPDGARAAYLLNQADVAVVPGSAFGLSQYFRISYPTSKAKLERRSAALPPPARCER